MVRLTSALAAALFLQIVMGGLAQAAPLTSAQREELMRKFEAGDTLTAAELGAISHHRPKHSPATYQCLWHENTNGTPFGVSGSCPAPHWPAGTPCACGSEFHDSGQTVHHGEIVVTHEGTSPPLH